MNNEQLKEIIYKSLDSQFDELKKINERIKELEKEIGEGEDFKHNRGGVS